jgi:hypothetical protein
MSHFACLVLTDEKEAFDVERAESIVMDSLSPYDENMEVEEYETDCYCNNLVASNDARQMAEVECGKSLNTLRDEYWAMEEDARPDWDEHIKDFVSISDRLEKEHKLYKKADPDCEDCNGTGRVMSAYNPDSKWDWFQVGGRWTGYYSDYDPSTDPKNIEECHLCNGTGMREGWAWMDEDGVHYKDDWAKECKGCNGCKGTGKSVTWPTQWENSQKDVMPASAVLSMMNKEEDPKGALFAILTPEGEWIESGSMGWWGMVTDEKDENEWEDSFKKILEKYSDHMGVVVDCHI